MTGSAAEDQRRSRSSPHTNDRSVLGVTTDALAKNSTTPWTPADLVQVNAFEQAARAHVGIVMWYADWEHARLRLSQLRAISQRGSIPEISWEPWGYSGSTAHAAPVHARLDHRRSPRLLYTHLGADAASLWPPGPSAIRPGDERELVSVVRGRQRQSPWRIRSRLASCPRHLHVSGRDQCQMGVEPSRRSARHTKESVSRQRIRRRSRPVGVQRRHALPWGGWRSFARIFEPSYKALEQIAPSKPIQISEVASAERAGSKAAWITNMFSVLHHYPQVKSLIWYDLRKQTNWPITSSRRAARAFAAGAAKY